MCLAFPAKVLSISNSIARVSLEGNVREINTSLLPSLEQGDWVLVHAGFGLERIDQQEGEETLRLLQQLRFTGEGEEW